MTFLPVTARWASGANATTAVHVFPATGREFTYTFVRPDGFPGRELDVQVALQAQLIQAMQAAQQQAEANARYSRLLDDVGHLFDRNSTTIESRIDGEFTGWEGETVFVLHNGQIWQQASYAYTYRYAYSPKVLMYKSGAGYKMKVDGVANEVSVRRLK